MEGIKGYKVFNPDWTCRGFKYQVGETYETNEAPRLCEKGFHFCERLIDCFDYYDFNSANKVAEILALGEVATDNEKSCTNKIKIVREISWAEVLNLANTGEECTGYGNSGNYNSGCYNSGNYNSGCYNSGDYNSGDCNSGDYNSGYRNSGDYDSGDYNSGNGNSGNYNSGNYNSGNYNSGDCNSGYYNSGSWNSGDWNSGYYNSGDWNETSFSNGCFNTATPKIYLFNKPSNWTLRDWRGSKARCALSQMPGVVRKYVNFSDMTDEEKKEHPDAETTGGYLREVKATNRKKQCWWNELTAGEKNAITSLPNFDAEIFREITGIDVGKEETIK